MTIEKSFPPSVIDFIKNEPYQWFIRLHPRQMYDAENIKNYLKKHDVLHLINIEQATHDPLPLLLINSIVHMTHFSGSALEASFLDVFNVLINETSLLSFPELISAEKAVYLNPDDEDFKQKLQYIIHQKKNLSRNKNITSFNENLFE